MSTKEDVLAAMLPRSGSRTGKRKIAELLSEFGAQNLTGLDPQHYEAVIRRLGEIPIFRPTPQDTCDVLGISLAEWWSKYRDPFTEWSYEDFVAQEETKWLCGSGNCPVLLDKALWQTMGLLKAGKTYFCMELAFCIAFGLPFHGQPTRQGNTCYVIAEGGMIRIFHRVEALYAKYSSELAAQGIMNIRDVTNCGRFNIVGTAIDLANPKTKHGVDAMLGQLRHRPYAAVWLDTWARMLWASGGHDSDPDTVGPAVRGCDQLRMALDCTVTMVAHIGVSETAQHRAKGLSDPAGAVDGATHCKKHGTGDKALFRFKAVYQRHAADGFEIVSKLVRQSPLIPDLVLVDPKEKIGSDFDEAQLPPTERQALVVLRGLGEGVTSKQWRAALDEAGLLGAAGSNPNTKRSAFKRIKDALLLADAVEQIGQMFSARTAKGTEEPYDD